METRWTHPLFKPSKKSTREMDIFLSAKRLSPKYYTEPELSTNLRLRKNKATAKFGQSFAPTLSQFLGSYRFTLAASVVFIACAISIFVLVMQTKFSTAPSIYAVNMTDLKFADLDPMNKESFLRRLSDEHSRLINSQVHYVSQLINNYRISDEEAKRMAFIIVRESINYGYDPLFIAAVIKSESTFKKHAVSPVGATGLMQIMPDTGKFVSKMKNVEWSGASKLRDPSYNIKLGIAYIKYLDEMFKGDKEKMLVAYNWGPANVMSAVKNSRRFPSSCLKYARSILNNHGRWNSDYSQKIAQFQYLNLEVLS